MRRIDIGLKDIIHFIGIGGIGMSGLALIMNGLGFKVQGSDISGNKNTVVMVEGEADCMSEEEMVAALKEAHSCIKEIIEFLIDNLDDKGHLIDELEGLRINFLENFNKAIAREKFS